MTDDGYALLDSSSFFLLLEMESSLLNEEMVDHRDNEVSPHETSIPTENVIAINGPNLNRTFTLRRKAAKRTEPWYLAPPPQNIAVPVPPRQQVEEIPARKKRRIEEPLATTTDEDARKTASPPDTSVGLPAAAAAADNDDANTEPVKDTHDVLDCRFDRAIGRNGYWTEDEDLKLKNSVQMHGGKDWNNIAAMVPGRTKRQCSNRWRYGLDPSIALPAGSTGTGTWAEDEDLKLKTAVQIHGGKDWAAIAVMVPGRTKIQCNKRWHNALDPSIALTAGRTGVWTEDEDLKLKAAVQMHGGKNWNKIAALVPGRTISQSRSRWHNVMDPSIAVTAGSTGAWTEDEVLKLKAVVQMHGDKGWAAIATMVPGRTKKQCNKRWHNVMDPSIALTAGSKGTWAEDEDLKLKAAVQMHGGKNWNKISAMVANVDRTPGRTGKWAEDEDIKLKGAVETHGGKDWAAIAALVPGRMKSQCISRWQSLSHSIGTVSGYAGRWTEDEDNKLEDAVQMHGGKDWASITALLPGRTKYQCTSRWHYALKINNIRVNGEKTKTSS
jgi:hypothetical protein